MFSGFVFVGLIVQLAWTEQVAERAREAQCADNTNCAAEACNVLIDGKLYCSQCNAGFVPINGRCAEKGGATDKCKDAAGGDTADQTCAKCAGQTFMYKRGCYEAAQQPGQTVCQAAENGKCTQAAAGNKYFVPPGADDAHDSIVECGDADGVTLTENKKYTGVAGCTTCEAPAALESAGAKAATCSTCGPDGQQTERIVKTDGGVTSCVTEKECTDAASFFVDTSSGKKCTKCDPGCKTCKEANNKCTSCNGDKPYLKKAQPQDQTGECVTAETCQQGGTHYTDDSTDPKTCRTCAEGTFEACEACEKSREGAVTCKTCGAQKKVQPNKKGCIAKCPETVSAEKDGACECVKGYVPDEAGTGCKEESAPPVAQCSTPGCKACDKPKAGEEVCTECEGAKALTPTGQCIDKCGDLGGYYEGTNDKKKKACKKCEVANCLLCNEKGKCAACKAGFYGEACAACNSACKNCSGPTAADCTECSSGRALKYDTTGTKGTCEAGCKPNANGCEKCELTVEGTTYCSKCKQAGQFPQNGVCSAAAGRAVTCATQGTGVCDKCTNGFLRMGGGCYETAKFPGKSVCADANADADTCKTPVPGYKVEAGKLVTCSEGCDTCSDANTCTKCKDGYVLTTSKCTPCSAGCATCTNTASACETCSTGYYKSKNACVVCTANNADNTITGVANCASCAPPSNNQGSVLCYLMKDGGSTNKGGLSTGAIAGIVVAVVIVVGGLVGFLCWWFMCKGKA